MGKTRPLSGGAAGKTGKAVAREGSDAGRLRAGGDPRTKGKGRDGMRRICAALAAGCGLLLVACGRLPSPRTPDLILDERTFASRPGTSYTIRLGSDGKPLATMVGNPQRWLVRKEDTLLDVARYFGLGFSEITQANPHLDPWIPTPGAMATVPTQWTLPCCTYEGLVVNVADMRLFHYRRLPDRPHELQVFTAAVGVGEPDHPTPRGVYRVSHKSVDPTWIIPESIRREHIRERGDHRRVIKGGDPENPLGKYRLKLSNTAYAIHGTNNPWGPGMAVSHGCVRMYPEDIHRLFPLVPVGTRVELTYQPVLIGRRGGVTYLQTAPDSYKRVRKLGDEAVRVAARHKLRGVSRDAIRAAAERSRGVPVVLADPFGAGMASPAHPGGGVRREARATP
jgi:L,D-transpeptidase ErfK/SrfK